MVNKKRGLILNAGQLRKRKGGADKTKLPKNDIYIILDNVLDTYNIGSVFRLADAVAAKKLYLCGGTETPPNSRIKKSSINTTEWVEWEYSEDAVSVIKSLKSKVRNLKVIAVEQSEGSVSYGEYDYSLPIAIVVGNESYGVLEPTLKECDAVLELPMFGVNVSLNVMVSLGIVLYQIVEKSKLR
jgi:23S rRNA (guanosine2251-2'-O)-methyltransferase